MLYIASYLEPAHHHGRLLSICTSVLENFKTDGKLEFLIPSTDLLIGCEIKQIDRAEYTKYYREQIKQQWQEVKRWLDSLDSKSHSTLLCCQPQGTFCHKSLVAKLVQKYRPDCFGGCDVLRVEMPLCKHCGSKMIPGLDANYCYSCNIWFNS